MKFLRLLPLLALALAPIALPAADSYKVDPVHSAIMFKVHHWGAGFSWGRFNKFDGTVSFDAADPAKSSVNFTVDMESVDSNSADRDKHLKSPDFFNSKQFPTATFKSTAIKAGSGKDDLSVTGDLTIRGITKPVTIAMKKTGEGKDQKGTQLAGAEGTFTIKRSDFDVKFGIPGVSDDVLITVALEAKKQ